MANTTYTSALSAKVYFIQITVFYTVSSSDLTGTFTASVILDSNGNLQRVKTLGTTGAAAPTWGTTIGGDTTDASMTWTMLGTGAQLPVLFGCRHVPPLRALQRTVATAPLGNAIA